MHRNITKQGIWTQEEHDRFLAAVKIYPQGPWRVISKYVGTRSVRQVQTHAQKYHEKIQRRMRGMHKDRKTSARTEHRIDEAILASCRRSEGFGGVSCSVLQKTSLDSTLQVTVSFAELLKHATDASSPRSPVSVDCFRSSDIVFQGDEIKRNDGSINAEDVGEVLDLATELPSFSESLDFLIKHFSD